MNQNKFNFIRIMFHLYKWNDNLNNLRKRYSLIPIVKSKVVKCIHDEWKSESIHFIITLDFASEKELRFQADKFHILSCISHKNMKFT